MALRPIDNALPATPELGRPRKLAKIAVAPPVRKNKRPDIAETMKNDENRDPPPQPNADAAIDYIVSEDLKSIPDPNAKIQSLVERLESKDWTVICDSLNDVRRFAIYHSNYLRPFLEKVIAVLVKAMKNPRSTLCKTSIMASSDIFNAYSERLMEPNNSKEFDQLLLQLLLKASQDKRFVCEEADKALSAMVRSAPPLPLLHKLQVYVSHANLRVRAKAAMSFSNCISKMSIEELQEFGLVPLLQKAGVMLNDRLPEAREAARSTVMLLHKSFHGNGNDQKEETWEQLCQANLPALHAQSIVKITLPQ